MIWCISWGEDRSSFAIWIVCLSFIVNDVTEISILLESLFLLIGLDGRNLLTDLIWCPRCSNRQHSCAGILVGRWTTFLYKCTGIDPRVYAKVCWPHIWYGQWCWDTKGVMYLSLLTEFMLKCCMDKHSEYYSHSSIYTSSVCPLTHKRKHVLRYFYQRQYRCKKSYNIYCHPFRTCNVENNHFSSNINGRWIQAARVINMNSWFQRNLEWYYASSGGVFHCQEFHASLLERN